MNTTNPLRPEVSAAETIDDLWVPWPRSLAQKYAQMGVWEGKGLDQILTDSARRFPARTAVVCGSRRVTYEELDHRVTRLAGGLQGLGIEPGDRIVVQMPNVLETIELVLAAFRARIIPVLALPGHRDADLSSFCEQARAVAYFTVDEWEGFDHRVLARRLVLAPDLSVRQCIIVGRPAEFVSFQDVAQTKWAAEPPKQPAAGRLALLQLSGGSTGIPKLIPRTHDDYYYSVRRSVEVCQLTEETVLLVALPLTHNFPMSSPGFLGCLMVGGTTVLSPNPSPDCVFPLLVRERVTMTSAVPAVALSWLRMKQTRGIETPALRLMQVGGAKLDPEQAHALLDGMGCHVQQVFGMAEGLVCYTPLGASVEEIAGTQGRPMSSLDEIRIVDDEGRQVAEGDVGHLQTRGPYTIRGYYDAPDHNQHAFTEDGFYKTGDIVRRHQSGALVVEGRAKEQINRGGEKVAAAELESHLASHPDVVAAAVIGIPDEFLGERICAFLVMERASSKSRESILRHLKDRGLAKFKVPDRIEFLDALPKTHVGKIDKKQLQNRRASLEDAETSVSGSTFDRLRIEVAALMEVEPQELSGETNLLEWGLDSIRVMQLVESLKARGADLSFIDIAENPTLEGIWSLTSSMLSPAS